MYDEIASEILKMLDDKQAYSSYPKFSGDGYTAYKIDGNNFHEIKRAISGKKIAFIDGGNAEIIGSANFSLNLVRVCCVAYQYNKKITSKKYEILAFARAVNKGNEIFYKTAFFKSNNEMAFDEILFNSLDKTLMLGINRAEISSVANAIRRFAELKIAKFIADGKIADIIVLDGNLQATLTNENKYLNELYESCQKNNVILAALSKTTSLFTDNGSLLSVVLGNMGQISAWFYHPIVEINNANHKAEMFFVKFHPDSRHVFRFEVFNWQKARAEEAINELAGNCIDPIFIGYPYGLVEADRIARVSNQEKSSLNTIFLAKLKNKNIERYLSSVNAHGILDSIMF